MARWQTYPSLPLNLTYPILRCFCPAKMTAKDDPTILVIVIWWQKQTNEPGPQIPGGG